MNILDTIVEQKKRVEVHDEAELDRALAVGAQIIGVNNRDLKSFQVDLATTERLAAKLRKSAGSSDRLLVAESGIHTRLEVERLARCGAQAILVGESLMKHADVSLSPRESVLGICCNLFAPVPAVQDMINRARIFHSDLARHANRLTRRNHLSKSGTDHWQFPGAEKTLVLRL